MAERDLEKLLLSQLTALGLEIPLSRVTPLLWFAKELLRWNRKINLTAIREMDEAIEKHLVDSLTLLPLLGERERLLDMGSGGGFPGLPLKIVRDGISLVSVDAVVKKINFQRHVARELNLAQCLPLAKRAEELPGWKDFGSGFDVVVSRAFASLRDYVVCALPCLRPAGRIIAMKGPEGRVELEALGGYLAEAGLRCVELKELKLPNSAAERQLLVLKKGEVAEPENRSADTAPRRGSA